MKQKPADTTAAEAQNALDAIREMERAAAWRAIPPRWFGALIALLTGALVALSVAGVDGSLEKRLQHLPGIVFGKTGTMRGVRSLCGYVMPHTSGESDGASPHTAAGSSSSTKPRFSFCIMFNGYPGPSTPYREIQDRICHALINAASIEIGTKSDD